MQAARIRLRRPDKARGGASAAMAGSGIRHSDPSIPHENTVPAARKRFFAGIGALARHGSWTFAAL
jgi:hypothetical protein